jgi:hypothetical protein
VKKVIHAATVKPACVNYAMLRFVDEDKKKDAIQLTKKQVKKF